MFLNHQHHNGQTVPKRLHPTFRVVRTLPHRVMLKTHLRPHAYRDLRNLKRRELRKSGLKRLRKMGGVTRVTRWGKAPERWRWHVICIPTNNAHGFWFHGLRNRFPARLEHDSSASRFNWVPTVAHPLCPKPSPWYLPRIKDKHLTETGLP